jgi:hypothetical protein
VAEISRGVFQRVLQAAFAEYPQGLQLVQAEVNCLFAEEEAHACSAAEELLSPEEEVRTSNHYFASTVTSLRQLLSKEVAGEEINGIPAEFANFLDAAGVKKIRAMAIGPTDRDICVLEGAIFALNLS